MTVDLRLGDMRETLAAMPECSVDAVVTDPPYELGFMGKAWDSSGVAFDPATWAACLRVLKPGGHLLAFGGTRTVHRIACAIEDAGFEIRDQIAWLYGTGFPKSLNVSKAIDKAAGAKREVVGPVIYADGRVRRNATPRNGSGRYNLTMRDGVDPDRQRAAPATEAARQWDGWGTALKPAMENIVVARKPLQGTVAANVQAWGTGAINIDGCRIGVGSIVPGGGRSARGSYGGGVYGDGIADAPAAPHTAGRWPSNVLLDPEAAAALDAQSGDADSASRFFYCAKAGKAERGQANTHPTVKPVDLMRYLCRLVTPPGGTVLDPFAGSGTTGIAAVLEGFAFIGVELLPDHAEIGRLRIAAAVAGELYVDRHTDTVAHRDTVDDRQGRLL